MAHTSHCRFVPSLETLADRLNLSPAPSTIATEYLFVATVQFTGGVRVASADVGGDNCTSGVGANETIRIDISRTELLVPAVQKIKESAIRM